MTAGAPVRVFVFDEKPYFHFPGVGDVQLFPGSRDTFNVRVVPGMVIAFERGANDEIQDVTVTLNESTRKASRAR